MTLFDLLNALRMKDDRPIWDVANGVEMELVKTEADSVVVRLKGNKHLGRVLQAGK